MNAPTRETLTDLLARTSAWRTISDDETLLSAPPEVQQAHLEASKILTGLKEGDVDPWLGENICCIVRKSTKYIVYLDADLEIRWWWILRANEQLVNKVQARVNVLKHESSFLLVQKPLQLPWKRAPGHALTAVNIRGLIAEAMAVALSAGTEEDCEKVLAEAERKIAVAKDQLARPVFAGWFFAAVAALAVVTGLSYVIGTRWIAPGDLTFVRMWLEAGLCGAFGALISALTRTHDLALEPAAGHRGLLIEAVARALIGSGGGLLLFFALEAGVLQAALSNDPDVLRGVRLFMCIAAGASERILPSLIGKAEDAVDRGKAQNKSDTAKPDDTKGAAEKGTAAEQPVG
jgi:hypothetical protein